MEKRITEQQARAIKKLAERANKRLQRATEGQRAALEYYVKKATGQTRFSKAVTNVSYQQAAAELKALEKFLAAPSTTKTGWRRLKQKQVQAATKTLNNEGYDLTDAEFAEIVEQVDSSNKKEFYFAINKVQAAKQQAGDLWDGSSDAIADAIAQKMSYQQAFTEARRVRR